jgi:glutamine amidotransferase
LGDAVTAHIAAGRPYLGICLGLQLLFASSDEAPGRAGLGVLEGHVARLPGGTDATTGQPLKIPHIGWNTVEPVRAFEPRAPLVKAEHFYFVHSFVVVPKDPAVIAATTDYGEPFVSAIAWRNVFACQFHPEKSQRAGLALLERFLAS